jgi:hypothetical protein
MVTQDEKMKFFLEGMKIQQSKMNAKISHLLEHNFKHEAKYVETQRNILREVIHEYEAVFTSETLRRDGWPQFEFEK